VVLPTYSGDGDTDTQPGALDTPEASARALQIPQKAEV
jgi:hypothetical protein